MLVLKIIGTDGIDVCFPFSPNKEKVSRCIQMIISLINKIL